MMISPWQAPAWKGALAFCSSGGTSANWTTILSSPAAPAYKGDGLERKYEEKDKLTCLTISTGTVADASMKPYTGLTR